jgi:hypothetical protein
MFGRIISRVPALALCLIAFVLVGAAQDLDTVTVMGKVSDTNGLPVVGATVTVTLTETGDIRKVTTDADGEYKIINLKPGHYKVSATGSGFGVQETNPIPTISAQRVQQDFKLSPADVKAETSVTVSTDSNETVDTTRTVVGGTVTQREIEELPNNTRNPLDLVFLLGGVTEEPLSARDIAEDRASGTVSQPRAPLEAGIFGLSGGAAYSNNLTVDGFDNNDDRLAQDRFQLPYDSVAEVQVITNQFSAEYGRASGGRVNQRTRAGSKQFHGKAYMFFRDDNLNANTWNNNRRNLPKLPLTEYNPGGTFSGPIPFWYFKNRTFFFNSYEFSNLLDTTQIDTVVPTAQNPFFTLPSPSGQGTVRPESPVPPSGLAAANLAPYIKSIDTPSKSHKYLMRVDHRLSQGNDFTISYQLGRLNNSRQYRAPTNTLDDALQSTTKDTEAINLTHNLVFNARTVNQFRYQYSNFTPGFGSADPIAPVFLITLRDNSTLVPLAERKGNATLIAGNSTAVANGNFSSARSEKRQQYADTLTRIFGSHTVRLGADLQVVRSRYFALADATGTYNFDSVADYLANRVVRLRRNFGTDARTTNTYSGEFLQDDWRATSNLSINFGLRYERESILKDRNNWGPRFAVAWDPFKKGKGVIRFGAGRFFNRALLRTIDDFTINQTNFDTRLIPGPGTDVQCFNVPANATQPRCVFLFSLGVNKAPPTLEELKASTITGVSTAFTNAANNFDRRLDPGLRIPESYQINVGFEREIAKSTIIEANFTWNRTIGLWREFNANGYKLPVGFTDYNDYLLRGNTNPALKFVNGDPNDSTSGVSAVVAGVQTINLANKNNSTAVGAPIGIAKNALLAQLGKKISNTLADVEQVGSFGRTQYQGLIVELRRGFRDLGIGFKGSWRMVYTLSKLMDDGIVNTSNGQFGQDFEKEFTRSLLDRRHRFVVSGTLQGPKWLAGLRFSPVIRLYSGAPINLGNGGFDRNLDEVSNDRPNYIGNLNDLQWRLPGDPISPSLPFFSLPPIGKPGGNLQRNAGRGPGQFIFDANLSREVKLGERMRVRGNVEVGNVFNHTVYTFGNDFIDFANITTAQAQQDFLLPQRTLRPRQIRLGLSFSF